MKQALSGIKVLDFTRSIAGPYCTKLLADYGAEVIKVEPSGEGDPARRIGPFPGDEPDLDKRGLFNYLNANKKGLTLNVETDTGAALFKKLVEKTDVLVENFAPNVMLGWGLDYRTLEKINPGLIMTSISDFGQTGPYKDFTGPDIVAQAMGGWMYSGGTPDREPLIPGGSLSGYIGGLNGAVATMTAVFFRNQTGVGQHVDISIQESLLSTNGYLLVAYSYLGELIPRSGSPYPYTILPCKDGYIGLNILTQSQWEMLCHFMGMPELIEDARYEDGRGRAEHREELTATIRPWLMQKGREELFYEGQEWRIPFCLVPAVDELLAFPQHRKREYFIKVDHPKTGKVTQPGAPFKMSETPWRMRRPAPMLGEHNEEVYLNYLGYEKEDLIRLVEGGII